mgnify:FL=1
MARRWLEPLGSSTLHNIRERGEEAVRVVDSLGAAPPAATTMEELRVDAAEQPLAASLSARTTPFVMRGAAKAWGWRAAERWSSAEALVAHYGDFEMDLADDVRLPLREYVEYAANNAADSPYYLVERSFQGERAALLDDFAPPSFFADDLLAEIPGSKRARYCFFGGARSGTFLHVDPLCTSAWNVCLAGRKRWCMLAPETDMAVHGLEHFAQGKHQLPVCWFLDEHPRLQRSAVAGKLTMLECVQGAGRHGLREVRACKCSPRRPRLPTGACRGRATWSSSQPAGITPSSISSGPPPSRRTSWPQPRYALSRAQAP